jgi:hypothetical protein
MPRRKSKPLAAEDGATASDRRREALQRKASILGRLGVPEERAYCDACGTSDLDEGLKRVSRSLLEWHHLIGLHEGPVMLLCVSCHLKRTAMMRLWPQRLLTRHRSHLLRLAAFLRAQSDYHAQLSQTYVSASRYVHRLNAILKPETFSKLGDPFHQEALHEK